MHFCKFTIFFSLKYISASYKGPFHQSLLSVKVYFMGVYIPSPKGSGVYALAHKKKKDCVEQCHFTFMSMSWRFLVFLCV